MLHITITSNLKPTKEWWQKRGAKFRFETKAFLKNEASRIEEHARQIVQTTVYDVYSPTVYIRTNHLKESMKTTMYHPWLLHLTSDPTIAETVWPKAGAYGGYGKYVAGEGPGIGFLSRNLAASTFPRPFHYGITSLSSSIYNNLERDLRQRFIDRVVKFLK